MDPDIPIDIGRLLRLGVSSEKSSNPNAPVGSVYGSSLMSFLFEVEASARSLSFKEVVSRITLRCSRLHCGLVPCAAWRDYRL